MDCGGLCNISIGGLAFRARTSFEVHTPISLLVTIGNNRLSLSARVVSTRKNEEGFIIGVEFNANDPATEESIEQLSMIGLDEES